MILQWVRQSLTAYYNAIIIRASNQLLEVPTSFVSAVVDMPQISPFASASISSVAVPADFLSGVDIVQSTLARAVPVKQLLSAHIANFCIRSGMSGLNLDEGAPAWLSSVVVDSGYYSAFAPYIKPISISEIGDVSYVVRRYVSVDAAFASYVTMARSGVSSLSLIKNPKDNMYYIVGVFHYRELVEEDEDSPNLTIATDDDLDDYIPKVSFEAEADLTLMSVHSLSGGSTPQRNLADFHVASAAFARHTNRASERNDYSIFLQAAADLARDATSSTNRLWSYSIFVHYLNRDEDLDRAVSTYRRLESVVNRGTQQQRGPLILDVSMVTTWLKYANLYADDNIPYNRVIEIMNRIPDTGVIVNIQQSVSFQKVKNFTQIREMLDESADRYSPGRVMAALLIIETLAIMPAEEEGEDVIDPASVDLDNFW